MSKNMDTYTGPGVVVVEGSDQETPVSATLTASTEPGSPIARWQGLLRPVTPGSLWPAHMAGWASLVIGPTFGDLRITVYGESGACDVEGIGPPPFWPAVGT